MHKIFCLLSCETFVLVAALFLYAYVKKNELGKLLQYGAAAIAIFIMVIMIGSVFTCCMPCYKGHGGGHGGKDHCSYNMGSGQNNCCMMGNMNCGGMSNNSCQMGGMNNNSCPMGGMNQNCCSKDNMENCEMGGDKNIEIEINDDGKDTVKKKVIIKKTK